MGLQIADIVTVIDEDLMCFNQQGKVIEIKEDGNEDGPIGVRFGPSARYLFSGDWRPDNLVWYQEKELRKDAELTLENQVIEKFGTRMWHTFYDTPFPFSEQNLCMSEEHIDDVPKASKRILINFVGSVYPIDVCKEHEHFDGKCAESWPFVDRPFPRLVS